ncbi:MAG TPA: hypothetical protein VK698_28910 [Kofleriaceae bacterium]|nr:hypothetical protein [Kofleriaceae bacterium]
MAPAWLSHLMDRLRAARADAASEEERRILGVLLRRGSFGDEASFLAALTGELAAVESAAESIDERTVELIAAQLRGHHGEELDRIGPHVREHLDLWSLLVRRSGSQLARACRADLRLLAGDRDGALDDFLEAVEGDPSLVAFQSELDELARERGGEAWLRYRLASLRAALAGLGSQDGDGEGDADDDHVRELYCELLEEFRAEPGAQRRIREVGALIDQAVDRGDLPRAIVRRAPRG